MKRIVMAFLISTSVLFGATTVKADLPPEPKQCASQGCLAVLRNGDITLFHEQEPKGTINQVGSGPGVLSYSKGWLMVARESPQFPDFFMYNLETSARCNFALSEECKEATVYIHPSDPTQDYAYVTCPDTMQIKQLSLDDCSSITSLDSSGLGPASITSSDDMVYYANNIGNSIGYYEPSLGTPMKYMVQANTIGSIRFWDDGINPAKLFFNEGSVIYQEDPSSITDYGDSVFYSLLPAGIGSGPMAVSDTHLLVAGIATNAYLVEIANPTNHIILPSQATNFVALSDDTAFVTENTANQSVTFAYDMSGALAYTLPIFGESMAYASPTVTPICWNGLIEGGETCDGSDVSGQTCETLGFEVGELHCNLTCDSVDPSWCSNLCGNNTAANAEACDGSDLKEQTCVDLGFGSGTLSCDGSCNFDTSQCSSCGNNMYEASEGEVCDGVNLNGQLCQTLGLGFTGGTLSCNSTCDDFDTTNCTMCGDGSVDPGEECDGNDLDGEICPNGGALGCYANCTYNFQGCDGAPIEICGNNTVDPGEECDDGDRLNGDGCDENCLLEPDPLLCGNNIIEGIEECDGSDLDGTTCESLGYDSGTVYCQTNCKLNINCGYINFQPANFNLVPNATPPPEAFGSSYLEITENLTETCIPSMDGSDLIMTTPEDGYCPLELNFGGQEPSQKSKQAKIFIMIYKPLNSLENKNASVRIRLDGSFKVESGGHMRAQFWVTPTNTFAEAVTEKTEASMSLRMEFLAIHPDPPKNTDPNGRFLLIEIKTGLATYCSVAQPDKCAVIPSGGVYILDFNKLEETLGEIGRKPKKSGCSIAGNSQNIPTIPAFIMMTMLLLAIRIRRHKKAANR